MAAIWALHSATHALMLYIRAHSAMCLVSHMILSFQLPLKMLAAKFWTK